MVVSTDWATCRQSALSLTLDKFLCEARSALEVTDVVDLNDARLRQSGHVFRLSLGPRSSGSVYTLARRLGDLDTADLFTEISGRMDTWLWFVDPRPSRRRRIERPLDVPLAGAVTIAQATWTGTGSNTGCRSARAISPAYRPSRCSNRRW